MHEYSVGTSTVIHGEFRVEATGQLVDPTTVSLKVRTPSGVATTYTYGAATVTKDSTGKYSKTVALTEAGTWAYNWIGTGTAAVAEGGTILVKSNAYGLD